MGPRARQRLGPTLMSGLSQEGMTMAQAEASRMHISLSSMSAGERKSFDRWLITNVVIGSVWAAALAAIVLIGPSRPEPIPLVAKTNLPVVSVVATAD